MFCKSINQSTTKQFNLKMYSSQQLVINQKLSLFIPRVFAKITAEEIANVFEKFDFGKFSHVDLVGQQEFKGNRLHYYNNAYVYFTLWYPSSMVSRFQEKVYTGNAVVFYSEPFYWKVFENRTVKHLPGQRKQRIQLSTFDKNIKNDSTWTNKAGAQVLMAINSFTIDHYRKRMSVLENEIAIMKKKWMDFDEKKLDSLSSEIKSMQQYFA